MEGLVSGMANRTRQITQRHSSDTDVRLGRFAPPEVSRVDAPALLRPIGLVSFDFSGKTALSTSPGNWPPAYHAIQTLTKSEFSRQPAGMPAGLPDRVFDDEFFLFAGEMNAITYQRSTGTSLDHIGLASFLEERRISIVLDPVSFCMRHWRIQFKRRFLSEPVRTVITFGIRTRGQSPSSSVKPAGHGPHTGEERT